ncbi:MAG: methyltransferase domain-containing protein [Cyclobacteriaceae bacterium]
MIARIKNKIQFSLFKLKIRSFSAVEKFSLFANLNIEIKQNKKRLQPYYEHYIESVSRADMAASVELAAFMFSICKINQFTKVLDMGSGLSSFVFRLYAKETSGVRVFSVDDDVEWLDKTKDFLRHYELDIDNIFTLDHFLKSDETKFDCILHDLNFAEVRINYIEQLMSMVKSGGLVVFDDVHKPDYLFALLKKLNGIRCTIFNLKPVTLDSYGRFSLVVLKH